MKNAVQTMLAIGMCMGSGVVAMDAGEALFKEIPESASPDDAGHVRQISKEWIRSLATELHREWSRLDKDAKPEEALDVLRIYSGIREEIIDDLLSRNENVRLIIEVLFANEGIHLKRSISRPQPSAPVPAPMHSHDCSRPPSRCD